MKLLNRTQSQVALTSAGGGFLEESRKVVAAVDRAVDIAQRTVRGEIGSLTIGFLIWDRRILSGIIRGFRQLHPGVRVSVIEIDWLYRLTRYGFLFLNERIIACAHRPERAVLQTR